VQSELANLITRLHRASAQSNTEFVDQVARTKTAISLLQGFFGTNNRSTLLTELDEKVTQLERSPNDYGVIRTLIEAEPRLLHLAGGPNEGSILEDQIKNLVTDERLKQELAELEAKLREFTEQQGDEINFNTMKEIQRLAELIRQSQSRSILETICKTEALYVTLAAIADTLTHSPGLFTVVTELGVLAAKVKTTAKNKLNEKMLEYTDRLEIKMADLRAKLPRGGIILAIPDASSGESG
jgi:hypothetical protein